MTRTASFHQATWIFRSAIQFAKEKNVSKEEILHAIGQSEEDLYQLKTLVDFRLLNNVMLLLYEKTNDPFIGIEFGATKNILSGHLIDSLLRSGDTVFDIIRKIEEYNAILSDFIFIKAAGMNDEFHACIIASEGWIKQYPVSSRMVRDFILTFFYKLIKEYSNGAAIPRKISINNPALIAKLPELQHKLIFKEDIHLSSGYDCLFYDRVCDVPMISSNRDVREALESRILQHSVLFDNTKSLSFKVKAQLMDIGDNILNVTIKQVADQNHISVRRLQQILKQEKTSFREIYHDVKLMVIKKLVTDHGLSIKESSDQVGYANTNSLYAFFKKRTGLTPGEFNTAFPSIIGPADTE
jgi:AraC-like DNA-binding protein